MFRRSSFDCHSKAVVDWLHQSGHKAAAADLSELFAMNRALQRRRWWEFWK